MVSIPERFRAAYRAFRSPETVMVEALANYDLPKTFREKCVLLDAYVSARVYRDLSILGLNIQRDGNFGTLFEKIRALENPAAQAVSFHVMHLFPGPLEKAMPLEVEEDGNDRVRESARQILLWSNMGRRKRYFTEKLTTHGEVFLQAATREDGRPYLKIIEGYLVTDYEEDTLGYLTAIRLDIYTDEKTNPWITQLWSKETQSLKQWRSNAGPATGIKDLGTPDETPFSEYGIDFVPFVRAPFIESGGRGIGVFEDHLEPIDELNRQATDIRRLFKENAEGLWAMRRNESGLTAAELEAIDRPGPDSGAPREGGTHGKKLVSLPGLVSLESLISQVDYAAGLNQKNDTRESLEVVMPELRYFKGRQGGDPSAAALREDCRGALSRAAEARGNAETAFIQGLQMCLSIGLSTGVFKQSEIGTFESGGFDLSFTEREIMPESPIERAARELAEANAHAAWASVSEEALYQSFLRSGYDDERARAMATQPSQPGANLAGLFGVDSA